MKTLLTLLTCLFILSPNVVMSEKISGTFNCKIKDITISEIDEGKPKTYKGTKGGAKIGGSMQFAYTFDPPDYFKFERTDVELGHHESFSNQIRFKPKGSEYKKIFPGVYLTEDSKGSLSSESLSIEGIVSRELGMTRYYKNDWQGLLVNIRVQMVSVYSLDCRNTADSLEKILRQLKQQKY